VAWPHEATPFGVFDLVGNVVEFVEQLKIIDGRVYCTLDNDPSVSESEWIAQDAYYDGVNIFSLSAEKTVSASRALSLASDISLSTSYVKNELMRRIGVEHAAATVRGELFIANSGERVFQRSGRFSSTDRAGLNAAMSVSKTSTGNDVSARSAFFV
jgi:hypothetical protein